jgi:hypothetical protein
LPVIVGYKSHREFHNLSKESGNSDFQYWTKGP